MKSMSLEDRWAAKETKLFSASGRTPSLKKPIEYAVPRSIHTEFVCIYALLLNIITFLFIFIII
ncbi:hypothetical protein HMPREF0762_01974 [Slackia exigua ATCC 700122]|uniref:Uncharacterized protein n=1 Tax=Slackia exigua (strain ATCC 700122 / DSM 15923 / CIP 105133 / JCM 11022 / KCTC 5966 / S-7) TaxID=649764 RepID=D0WJE8_SLAES|nr:hypothetical protein HMPREF0762_01974 [Slackia exigua ATCC 700122]